jgi:feruloyl-CoA synthase
VLLDWLPWSHTLGGNHDTHLGAHQRWEALGRRRPSVPGRVERTVRNLSDARPTVYLNVPAGFAALLPHLEREPAAARAFLDLLRLGFFAAAALPQQLRDRLHRLATGQAPRCR